MQKKPEESKQYLAPPLASEAPEGLGGSAMLSSSSSLSSRISVRASIEAATPLYLGIKDLRCRKVRKSGGKQPKKEYSTFYVLGQDPKKKYY